MAEPHHATSEGETTRQVAPVFARVHATLAVGAGSATVFSWMAATPLRLTVDVEWFRAAAEFGTVLAVAGVLSGVLLLATRAGRRCSAPWWGTCLSVAALTFGIQINS